MTARSMRQQPFTIYDEFQQPFDDTTKYEPRMSTSPSPYDADGGLSSDENESIVLPSIETQAKGRQSSAAFTSISSIPPSLPYNSDVSPYTPRKGNRPAFRSPSSVRAMQMSSPPPFAANHHRMGSPMSASPRRARAGTPSSIRSGSVLHRTRDSIQEDYEHSVTSGRGTPSIQQHSSPARGPLVLLHVTVLPSPGLPYSMESLQEHAPSYVLQNWCMLQDKLTETVSSRGVLIPHPGEEFDLLEESLLETLGLISPRIGSCGHFHGAHIDSDTDSGNDSGVSGVGKESKELIILSSQPERWCTHSDIEDTCHDCAQPIRVPGMGIGSGNARWDIKVYASNGLLSAGAWFAAHREMERVDVEIEPWIPEDVRRALDIVLEREQERSHKQHEELEKLRFDLEVMQRLRSEADDERARAEQRVTELEVDLEDVKRSIPPALPPIAAPPPVEDILVLPRKRESSDRPQDRTPSSSPLPSLPTRDAEIPLSTLLRNYLILLLQDRRNIAVGVLSVLVIFLSLRLGTSSHVQAATIAPLSDTTLARNSNNIQKDIQQLTSAGRYLTVVDDTASSVWTSIRSPVVTESIPVSASMTPSLQSVPIPSATASSVLLEADPEKPVESPPATANLRPKLESVADSPASHSSLSLQQELLGIASDVLSQGAVPTRSSDAVN